MVDKLLTTFIDFIDAENAAELFDEKFDVVIDVARPGYKVGDVAWGHELLKFNQFNIFSVLVETDEKFKTLLCLYRRVWAAI